VATIKLEILQEIFGQFAKATSSANEGEYVSVVTLNFKNVLCSYRGIKILQIQNLPLLLIFAYGQTAVKHVITKALF